MTSPVPAVPRWRRSSYCTGSDSTCVDVAVTPADVAVRDSKDPDGPVLLFTPREWRAFLLAARDGEFDLPTPSRMHASQPRDA